MLAYEKDPVTGIVRHLDDQCIGCQYCVLKCPYDVPKYSERLGIVRKCDMCHQRLGAGEAPACVQSCPTQAIKIVKVSRSAVTEDARLRSIPPRPSCAPRPILPTPNRQRATCSSKPLPANLAALGRAALRPQPPHWPLVALLMLMPMAVGCGIADKILNLQSATPRSAAGLPAPPAWLAALHLGKPPRAWKVFLNLRPQLVQPRGGRVWRLVPARLGLPCGATWLDSAGAWACSVPAWPSARPPWAHSPCCAR